jgi:hypothetical protein
MNVDFDFADDAFPLEGLGQIPGPPPLPAPYKIGNKMITPSRVEIVSGVGWAHLPAGILAGQVENCVLAELDPSKDGYYKVPSFVGVSTDGKLLFGPGPYGPAADGWYTFNLITAA